MSDDVFANLPRRAEELGSPLAYHRNRPGRTRLAGVLGFVVRLVLAAAFLGIGLSNYGNPEGWAIARMVTSLILGAACLRSAIRLARRRRRDGNVRGVVIYPGGLVCVLSDKSVVVAWDEVESIWDGGRRFRIRGGPEMVLPDSLEGGPDVAETLLRETLQRMAICASAMLLSGRTVEFGPVTVTRDELMVGSQRIAWSDFGALAIAWGRVHIFRKGQRLPVLVLSLAEVPNVHALWALSERLREGGFGSIVIGPGQAEPTEEE